MNQMQRTKLDHQQTQIIIQVPQKSQLFCEIIFKTEKYFSDIKTIHSITYEMSLNQFYIHNFIQFDYQMDLPNPYFAQPHSNEQQQQKAPFEPPSKDQFYHYDQNQLFFAHDNDDFHSQPSPSFHHYQQPSYQDHDAHSENIPHRTKNSHQLSGVHEKYLQSEHHSLKKQSFRTERKALTSKSYTNKFKKTSQIETNTVLEDLNPISSGLMAVQIDTTPLKEQIILHSQSEQQKGQLFTQLGLKQPKTLGKAKTELQLQVLLTFLQTGQLPEEYITDFLLLVSA